MDLPGWFETATLTVLGALLLFDLAIVMRRPHVPSIRECTLWVTFYVALAMGFALVLALVGDTSTAGSFVAGWITEYSLSVDNLFVFVVIMGRFAVPRASQQEILMIGIILSLILRGGFILLGAAAIERYSWVFYLFGGFLIYTAVQLVRGGLTPGGGSGRAGGYTENAMIRRARRVLSVTPGYHGSRIALRVDGRRMVTPLFIVFLAIGSTDLLFALDSIPAIFGLTKDPFIVFTATLFALMGLRQLYFLLGGLLDRLVYLSVGLSIILGFIGVKLILEALSTNELDWMNNGEPLDWAPVVPIWASITVILVVLVATTLLSMLKSSRSARQPT